MIETNTTVTVTIDALTDPTNMTIQSLSLGAPTGATNSVLLNMAGTNNPLVLQLGLELTNGAALRITNSALLAQLINDHVNIDGSFTLDSGLVDFGDITVTTRVGRATSGTLTINSGTFNSGAVTVGGLTNSTGLLNLNGGMLNVPTLFSLGRNPGTTGTVAVAGGQIISLSEITRIGDTGVGAMTLSNAVVWLTNLDIGRDPLAVGTLTLQNGALMLISNELAIARFNGATGSVVAAGGLLGGAGLKIDVGNEGNGQMNVSGGTVQCDTLMVAADLTNSAVGSLTVSAGSVIASANVVVGAAGFSSGQVSLNGGSSLAANTAGSAFMIVANGVLGLNGGTLSADHLLLTNATGQIAFNSGTIIARSTTVANGAAFVIGDGISAATLHLSGGVHSFANGLVISSNAVLSGCGAILGTIINHGTIATNCAALVRPNIKSLIRKGSTNTVSFTTVASQVYTLEFKGALNGGNWVPVGSAASGDGNVMEISDTAASDARRFYHVRAQ
jgi:hypothetical protein